MPTQTVDHSSASLVNVYMYRELFKTMIVADKLSQVTLNDPHII